MGLLAYLNVYNLAISERLCFAEEDMQIVKEVS